jgi:hypothetical protein
MFLELDFFSRQLPSRRVERLLLGVRCQAAGMRRRKTMKIYLLILLIGTILTAIRFTSAPKQRSETLPR